MSAKQQLEEDGVDASLPRFPEELPLPPYPARFRLQRGRIQFRLRLTDHWCAVDCLKDDEAYIAMAVARCSFEDLNQDPTSGEAWFHWFKKRVVPVEPAVPGSVARELDDSPVVRGSIRDDFENEDHDPAEVVDMNAYDRRLEKNPAMLAEELPKARVIEFAKRANGLIMEMVVRAASEMQDKKNEKVPDTKLPWVAWAEKHLPKCILEELANGPALDIVRYRARRVLPCYQWDGESKEVVRDRNAMGFFSGQTPGSRGALERLQRGLCELSRRVLGSGNGNGGGR